MGHCQISISIARQTLRLLYDGAPLRTYSVSTAKTGAGEQRGSGCTPRGAHVIRAKIGAGSAPGTVFVGRRPTGEIYATDSPAVGKGGLEPDLILSRILWLCGLENGKNRFGNVDTMKRYIYLHGCANSAPVGEPLSHGCVRMRNDDIIELFDLVDVGTAVTIHAE